MSTEALDFSSFDEENKEEPQSPPEAPQTEDFDTKVMESMQRHQSQQEEEAKKNEEERFAEKEQELLSKISQIEQKEEELLLEKRIEEVVNEVPDETLEVLKTLSADYGDSFSKKMLFNVTDIEGFANYVITEEGKEKLQEKLFAGTNKEMWDAAQKSQEIRNYINNRVDKNLTAFCSSFESMAKAPRDDIDRISEEYPIENEAFSEANDYGSMTRDQYLRYMGRQSGTLMM